MSVFDPVGCVYMRLKLASVASSLEKVAVVGEFKFQACVVFWYPFAERGVQASRELHGLQRQVLREPLEQVDAQHQDLDRVGVRQVCGLERAEQAKHAH